MKSANFLGRISIKLINNPRFLGVAETTIDSLKMIGITAMENAHLEEGDCKNIMKEIGTSISITLVEFIKCQKKEPKTLELSNNSINGQARIIDSESIFYEISKNDPEIMNKKRQINSFIGNLVLFFEEVVIKSLRLSKPKIADYLIRNLELLGIDIVRASSGDDFELRLSIIMGILKTLKAINKEAKFRKNRDIIRLSGEAIYNIENCIKNNSHCQPLNSSC